MANQTMLAKRNFNNTIGAGIRSIFSGRESYFILEHQVGSKSMSPGYSRKFIVDFVELGRGKSCNFRFGESDATVSRVHAAIYKEGNRYILSNRSKTNVTMVNGQPVIDNWYLSNGDAIQLSTDGPKINFIIPVNNATGTIGLTQRFSMFAAQSLRPVKTLLFTAFAVLILLIAGLSYYLKTDFDQSRELQSLVNDDIKTKFQASLDSVNEQQRSISDSLSKQIASARTTASRAGFRNNNSFGTNDDSKENAFKSLKESYEKDIFFLLIGQVSVLMPNGNSFDFKETGGSGTAFLTNEGKLITARHCIEPWNYPYFIQNDDDLHAINILIQKGGTVRVEFDFYDHNGDKKFSLPYSKFRFDTANDVAMNIDYSENVSARINVSFEHCNDIAYAIVKDKGDILLDMDFSDNLSLGKTLYSIGYPRAYTAGKKPVYSTNTVSYDGLHNDCIIITDRNIDSGSSGGPMLTRKGNKYVAVGVVTGGMGSALGRITPVSSLQYIY